MRQLYADFVSFIETVRQTVSRCRKLAQRGQRGRGSTGIPGAWRKVWLQCTDKCLDHQALANAECRKEDNLGQECLPRQAAEVQLARYYCSAQRYTEVAHIDIAGPVDQNILTTEVEKVERYQNLALKSKRINSHPLWLVLPIVIGTLSPRMKKAWYGRLPCLTVLDEHSCWPSLVLLTSWIAESVVSLSCGKLLNHGWEDPKKTRELKRIMIIIIDTGQCHLPDMWMVGGGGVLNWKNTSGFRP